MFQLLNAPRFASFQGPIIGGIAHPFLIFPFLVGNLEDTKSSNLGHLDRATSGQSCSVFERMYKKNHIFNGANQERLQDVQDSPALKNSTEFVPILGQERDCQRNGTSHKWIHLSNRPAQAGKERKFTTHKGNARIKSQRFREPELRHRTSVRLMQRLKDARWQQGQLGTRSGMPGAL
jgi:hypothetical protein